MTTLGKADPLDFLGSKEEQSDPLSFLGKGEAHREESEGDPLDFLPKGGPLQAHVAKEKTREQVKSMSPEERQEYAQENVREREMRQSRGFLKGLPSGVSLGYSQGIEALKKDEDDFLFDFGHVLGITAPAYALNAAIGAPLVMLAATSPVARTQLMALAELTGIWETGAIVHGVETHVIEGRAPSLKEMAEAGAWWATIHTALKAIGLVADFKDSVQKIAGHSGRAPKDVLKELVDVAIMKAKPGINPTEILAEDAENLFHVARMAGEEIEARAMRLNEKGEPIETTAEVPEPVKETAEAPKEAPEEAAKGFTTAKGSTYEVHEDGTTTRNKAARPEHPGEEGPQEKSDKTWYVTPENAKILGEVQTSGESKTIVEFMNGKVGVLITSGDNQGVETRTLVDYSKEPEEGLLPVEVWKKDGRVHFGNVITKVEKIPKIEPVKEAIPEKVVETPKEPAAGKEATETNPEKHFTKVEPLKLPGSESDFGAKVVKRNPKKPTIYSEEYKGNKIEIELNDTYFPNIYVNDNLIDKSYLDRSTTDLRMGELITATQKGDNRAKKYVIDILSKNTKEAIDKGRILEIKRQPEEIEEEVSPTEELTHKEEVSEEEGEIAASEERVASTKRKAKHKPAPGTGRKQPVIGKKQAVARSTILKLFTEAFKHPIRLGKIKQKKALGIHKLWSRVTRLLKANDVETAAHEIGHYLHTLLYDKNAKTPKEMAANINAALRPHLGELKPLAKYEPFGMEGFAEFTRMYVTNPDKALELAPKFYAKFEADLDLEYPELKNALLKAREYYDSYLQGTPQSRIRAQTSYGEDKTLLTRLKDFVTQGMSLDDLKTQFIDDVYPAKRAVADVFGIPISEVENLKDEKNLYRSLRVLKGAVGKADVFAQFESFSAKTLEKVGDGYKAILDELPSDEALMEFNDYLIARRVIEKTGKQRIETGINLGDAIIVHKDLKPKYDNLSQSWDKLVDDVLRYPVDAGLISEEGYKKMRDANVMYAPFQREMERKGGGQATGAGKLQAGKVVYRMYGSTRNIIAPTESFLKNLYAIIMASEKNLSGQVLANLATMKGAGAYVEAVPTPIKLKAKVLTPEIASALAKSFLEAGLDDLIVIVDNKVTLAPDIEAGLPEAILSFGPGRYPAGENIVTVYFNGKPKYYEVSPELFEMWNKGIEPYTMGLLGRVFRTPARTLRAGAILNPRFIVKNPIRDTWGTWIFTRYGKNIFKDPVGFFIDTLYRPLQGLTSAARKDNLYVEFMKSGGGMSSRQSLDRATIIKKLDEVRKGYKHFNPMRWLRTIAEISEEANRLVEFGEALKVEGKTRLGREIAAFASRDISIDFAKTGLQVKALNQVIPFFNATLQGGDKFLRTMFNPKARDEFLARALAFVSLPALIFWWLNKDDKNIKEFHDEERDFNFITKIGGDYLKIPVPFETGVIVNGLTTRMLDYIVKKDPDAFEGYMGSIKDAMLPNAIPTLALPFIETWTNKSFFTGGRIVPRQLEELEARYQYKDNTSVTARLVGRAMAYMYGGEHTRSKAASPAIIDHFIKSWTGGLGSLIVKITDEALKSLGLGDKSYSLNDSISYHFNPLTVDFPRAHTKSIEKFYEYYSEASSRNKSLKYAEKEGILKGEAASEEHRDYGKIYNFKSMQKAHTALQNSQKAINNILHNPTIDPERKKELVHELYEKMIDVARRANEDVLKYRLYRND